MVSPRDRDAVYTRLVLPVLLGAALALVLMVMLVGGGMMLICRSPTLSRRRKAARCVGLVVLVLLLPVLVLLVPVRPRSCWQNRGAGQQLAGCGFEQCVYADPNNDALVIKALPVPGFRPDHRVGGAEWSKKGCTAHTCSLWAYLFHRSHGWMIMQHWKTIQELQQTRDPVGQFFPTVHALDSTRMLVTVDRVPYGLDQAVAADQALAELNAHLKRLDLIVLDANESNIRTDSAGHIKITDPHLIAPKTWAVFRSQWWPKFTSFNAKCRFRGHSQLVPQLPFPANFFA